MFSIKSKDFSHPRSKPGARITVECSVCSSPAYLGIVMANLISKHVYSRTGFCGLEQATVSFLMAAGKGEYFLTVSSLQVWTLQRDRAGSGKKELAENNLPTSEVWLHGEETSWPQDSEQGAQVQQALPRGVQPKGTFKLQMPDSVSVNAMCFLFRTGVGAVIVRHILCQPKCKQREIASMGASMPHRGGLGSRTQLPG